MRSCIVVIGDVGMEKYFTCLAWGKLNSRLCIIHPTVHCNVNIACRVLHLFSLKEKPKMFYCSEECKSEKAKYCCGEERVGEMIDCSNERGCPYNGPFHMDCVGETEKPSKGEILIMFVPQPCICWCTNISFAMWFQKESGSAALLANEQRPLHSRTMSLITLEL